LFIGHPLVALNAVILLPECCGMHQFLLFEACHQLVTPRYNGIAFSAAIHGFKCKLCQMCHIRSLLFGYS
jgi:hypothetical protein